MKNVSFLMVFTANGPYAYKREDGVYGNTNRMS